MRRRKMKIGEGKGEVIEEEAKTIRYRRKSPRLRGAHTRWLSQWIESRRWTNSQHSKMCVSLSSCRKLKLKGGNKSFVPVPSESSVFRVFWIPMRMNILWTYVHFTYSYHGYVTICHKPHQTKSYIYIYIYIIYIYI